MSDSLTVLHGALEVVGKDGGTIRRAPSRFCGPKGQQKLIRQRHPLRGAGATPRRHPGGESTQVNDVDQTYYTRLTCF